jgi:hypothetical protein
LPNRIRSRLDIEGNALAVLPHLAIAGGDHRATLRLLFRRVRDDDPAALWLALFEAANDESIVQRSGIHEFNSHL